MGGVHLGDMN